MTWGSISLLSYMMMMIAVCVCVSGAGWWLCYWCNLICQWLAEQWPGCCSYPPVGHSTSGWDTAGQRPANWRPYLLDTVALSLHLPHWAALLVVRQSLLETISVGGCRCSYWLSWSTCRASGCPPTHPLTYQLLCCQTVCTVNETFLSWENAHFTVMTFISSIIIYFSIHNHC